MILLLHFIHVSFFKIFLLKNQHLRTLLLLPTGVQLNPTTGHLNMSGSTSLDAAQRRLDDVVSGMWHNQEAEKILKDSGIPMLGSLSSNMSIALVDQHIGNKTSWTDLDCLHQCQGGKYRDQYRGFHSSLSHNHMESSLLYSM